MYEAESAGQAWLAQVHAAAAEKGEALRQADLPAGTALDGDVASALLEMENGRTLAVEIRLTAQGYTVLRWENSAQWTENTDIGDLWTGSLAA